MSILYFEKLPVLSLTHYYVLDKGYDSEEIHRQIREELQAISLISIRNWKASHVNGLYRQRMARGFDRAAYRKLKSYRDRIFSCEKKIRRICKRIRI